MPIIAGITKFIIHNRKVADKTLLILYRLGDNPLNRAMTTINRNGISVTALGNMLGIGITEIIKSILIIKIIAST